MRLAKSSVVSDDWLLEAVAFENNAFEDERTVALNLRIEGDAHF